jgi:hypothetical protein
MASQYTTSLKIQEIGNGEQSGVWGTTTNTNWQLAEQAIAGVQTITMANANYTLSNLNGVLDEARNMVLVVQGTNSSIYQIVAPLNQSKMYVVSNQTTGGYAITIGSASGSIVTIPNGVTAQVYTDGTNFYSAQTGSAGNFTVNGTLTASGVTDTGALSAASLAVSGTSSLAATSFSVSPTAPTPTTGDNSTKVATTAFVTAAIPTTGTMAAQNANNVAITGGTINGVTGTASGLTVGNATNATTATTATTATNATQFQGKSKLGLGITGETWHNVVSSRSSGTVYTNSNSYPIMVSVGETSNSSAYLYIDGVWVGQSVGNNMDSTMTAIVPAGSTYYATFGGLNFWAELY